MHDRQMAMTSSSPPWPVWRPLSSVFFPHEGQRTRFRRKAPRQVPKKIPTPRAARIPETGGVDAGQSQCMGMEPATIAKESEKPRMRKRFLAET